jgi:hypothetical protein
VPIDIQISRRSALSGAAGVALFAGVGSSPSVAIPLGAQRARHLDPGLLAVLAAVVDRVLPGVPEDTVPGAVAGGVHEAIDALLGAFSTSPPRIYAGGPFSDRGGSTVNHFEDFVSLDAYETKAWKLRILGSRGVRQLERNGPIPGYQAVYRAGLTALEAAVPLTGFAAAPGPARDLALQSNSDPAIAAMLDLAVTHTLEFFYGAPEYGGNRDLLGWTTIGFEGDRQPRGYTRKEVTDPESSGPADMIIDLIGVGGIPAAALGSTELLHGVLAASGGNFSQIQTQIQSLVRPQGQAAAQLGDLHVRAQDLIARAKGAQA